MNPKRVLRLGLAGLVLAVVLLELGLQIRAAVAAASFEAPHLGEPEPFGNAVLCIGDSWTAGIGASDIEKSYPEQLEARLQEQRQRGAWVVVNGAQPGQDSRQLLTALPQQLDQVRPRIVCVLAGLDDLRRRPERHQLEGFEATAAGDDGFRLRWRGRDLVRRLFRGSSSATKPAGNDVDEAAFPPAPIPSDDDRPPARPADPETAARRAAAWQAYRTGDHARAIEEFEAAVARDAGDSESLKILTECYMRLGQADVARQRAARLEELYAAEPGPWLAIDVLRGLQNTGAGAPLRERARQVLDAYPGMPDALAVYGWSSFEAGDVASAVTALDAAVVSPRYVDPSLRARWHGYRAITYALGRGEPVEAIRSVYSAYLCDRDRAGALAALRRFPWLYMPEARDRALAGMDVSAPTRKLLEGLGDEAIGADRGIVFETLEAHLRQVIGRCRSSGAEPVLLTYGVPLPDHVAMIERLAAEYDVAVVKLHDKMVMRHEPGKGSRHFDWSGHPNDAGHALIARSVAAVLFRML